MVLKRNAQISSILLRLISAVLTFLNGIVLARILGPETYGQYVLILSWISLAYFAVTAGLPTLLLREISLSNPARDDAATRGVVLFALSVFGGLLLLCGLLFALVHRLPGVEIAVEDMPWITGVIVAFWGLSILFENATRGLGHTTVGQMAELVLRPGLGLVLFLGVVWLRGTGQVTETDAVLALLATTLATAGFSGVVLWHHVRAGWQRGAAQGALRPGAWRDWIRGTLHNSVTNILLAMTLQISFLMVGRLAGDAALGLYRVGYQLSIVAGIGLLAAKAVVGPQIGRSLRNHVDEPVSQVMRRAIGTCLLFSLPLCGVLLLWPAPVLDLLYGARYAGTDTVLTLQVLALGVIANSAFGPIDVALQVGRHDRMMMLAALVRIVLHLGLLVPLTRFFGIPGAAAAHALALVAWCVIMLLAWKRGRPGASGRDGSGST